MPDENPDSSHRDALRRDFWLLAPVVICVALMHVWILSAGKMWPRQWPEYGHYYSLLSDAFRHGQTHLLILPDAKLLALPDPYDPAANADLRLHDALLKDGKYYLYWGPVPALLLVPVRWIGPAALIPDSFMVFVFAEGLVLISGLLLLHIRRRFFPDLSRYAPLLMTAAAGLMMPVPFMLARAAVYEASILAGQLFLFTGILLAAVNRVSAWRLSLSGLLWAMAVGTRQSLVLPVVALSGLVAWRVLASRETPVRARWAGILALATPLITGALLLGAYNYTRFGSWSDMGVRYQLSSNGTAGFGPELVAVRNVPPNLFSYLFRPWTSKADFPGIRARDDVAAIPKWITLPRHYQSEPATGIVWTTPILVLAAVPVFRLVRRRWDSGEFRWIVAAVLLAGVLGSVPSVMFIGSTMRYLADLTPSLVLLSAVGLMQAQRWLTKYRRRRDRDALLLATIAVGYSVLVAMAFSLSGYNDHFRTHNPALLDRMSSMFGGG